MDVQRLEIDSSKQKGVSAPTTLLDPGRETENTHSWSLQYRMESGVMLWRKTRIEIPRQRRH